jgi:predicted aconitase with swiveling domain
MGREDTVMAVFKGKSVAKMGTVEGNALVTKDLIAFWAGTDWETGEIVEIGHEARGKNVADKILVFPRGKGGCR